MRQDSQGEARALIAVLARRRRELGITQEELAARTGLQQAAIARMERGAVVPRLDTVVCVASALGLRVMLAWGATCVEESIDGNN